MAGHCERVLMLFVCGVGSMKGGRRQIMGNWWMILPRFVSPIRYSFYIRLFESLHNVYFWANY